jgi:hypothetical protein
LALFLYLAGVSAALCSDFAGSEGAVENHGTVRAARELSRDAGDCECQVGPAAVEAPEKAVQRRVAPVEMVVEVVASVVSEKEMVGAVG